MKQGAILTVTTLLTLFALEATAIEDLKIEVQGADVVLNWPSVDGETYIVQHRASFEANTPWVSLITSLPATVGMNQTYFVHQGIVQQCNSSLAVSTSGAGLLAQSLGSLEGDAALPAAVPWWARWQMENRKPHAWEKEQRPPFPWEAAAWSAAKAAQMGSSGAGILPLGGESSLSGSGSCPVNTGFYRVVRKGARLFGMIDGATISGELEWPLEIGSDDVAIPEVMLHADGVFQGASEVITRQDGSLAMKWDTRFIRNGVRKIDLAMVRNSDDTPVRGRTNSVSVNNPISFFDYPLSFGYQMWVLAELSVQQADFEVWMHDENNVPLVGFAGSTTDGFINFVWNLTDFDGNPVNDEIIDQVVTLFPYGSLGAAQAAASPSASTTVRTTKENAWSQDDFIVAWGDTGSQSLLNDIETVMIVGVVSILDDLFRPDPYFMSPGNVPYGSVFKLTPQSKPSLLSYFADPIYRNFFWFGHGNGSDIGYSENVNGNRGDRVVSISTAEIKNATGNRGGRRPHPYRFVFLHCCLSAEGGMPTVFGIDEVARTTSYYANKGRRAGAFVGVKEICSIPAFNMLGYGESITEFFAAWMDDAPLNAALLFAQRPWVPGLSREPLMPELKIFGAQDMQRNGP